MDEITLTMTRKEIQEILRLARRGAVSFMRDEPQTDDGKNAINYLDAKAGNAAQWTQNLRERLGMVGYGED